MCICILISATLEGFNYSTKKELTLAPGRPDSPGRPGSPLAPLGPLAPEGPRSPGAPCGGETGKDQGRSLRRITEKQTLQFLDGNENEFFFFDSVKESH